MPCSSRTLTKMESVLSALAGAAIAVASATPANTADKTNFPRIAPPVNLLRKRKIRQLVAGHGSLLHERVVNSGVPAAPQNQICPVRYARSVLLGGVPNASW